MYLPYYTCDVVLEPFDKLGVEYELFHIDIHLEIFNLPTLNADKALLYVNYYGLKQCYVESLAAKIGVRSCKDLNPVIF